MTRFALELTGLRAGLGTIGLSHLTALGRTFSASTTNVSPSATTAATIALTDVEGNVLREILV